MTDETTTDQTTLETQTTTDDTATATTTAPAGDDTQTDGTTVLGEATTDDGAGDKGGDDTTATTNGDDDKSTDAGPPEAYELKLTTQNDKGEETAIDLDPALLEAATPVFKEVGLTNAQAQKLAPLALKVQERMAQQQADQFEATKADWAKEAQADPEIGGKNWKSTQQLAARALDTFIGPKETTGEDGKPVPNAFRQLLNDTGLGNHPAMIRAFRKIGEGLAEDGAFPRPESKTVVLPREELLYPDDVPKKK